MNAIVMPANPAVIRALRHNAGIGSEGDIGVKIENTNNTQANTGIPVPIVEKRAGGVEITTTSKLICDGCGKDTGRHNDGKTDSVVCPHCGHRVR